MEGLFFLKGSSATW